ncbi:hypothetical protein, partial [Cereibacter azotoformans]|uniref:hypothetical protein n=1 Tax=Cereibacter azotoformans TaxID=43057 RepID=UPI00195C3EC2
SQDHQRGRLGQRLLLAGQFALQLLDPFLVAARLAGDPARGCPRSSTAKGWIWPASLAPPMSSQRVE